MNDNDATAVVDAPPVEDDKRKPQVVIFDSGNVLTADELLGNAAKATENLRKTVVEILNSPPERSTGILAAAKAIRARRRS